MQGIIKPDAVMETVRHCETANLDYIPSDINLASSEMMMSTMISRETILKRILLKEITCNYDFVLIDGICKQHIAFYVSIRFIFL